VPKAASKLHLNFLHLLRDLTRGRSSANRCDSFGTPPLTAGEATAHRVEYRANDFELLHRHLDVRLLV
jgi:hypothetical protein